MNRKLIAVAGALLMALSGCTESRNLSEDPAGTAAPGPALAWARPTAVWDDGLAEVAEYDARWVTYGQARTCTARLITVKEAFATDRAVKADPPLAGRATLEVLKQNLVMEVPTDNYPYRFLQSVFVEREHPARLYKAATSSQEWCGATFQLFRGWTKPPSRVFHSYFDGEGDGETALDVRPGDLFRDQLFTTLRFAAADTGAYPARLWPTMIGNRAAPLAPAPVTVTVTSGDTVTAAGRSWRCRTVVVAGDGFRDEFCHALEEGGGLVRYRSADGREFTLRSLARRDYWTRAPR